MIIRWQSVAALALQHGWWRLPPELFEGRSMIAVARHDRVIDGFQIAEYRLYELTSEGETRPL